MNWKNLLSAERLRPSNRIPDPRNEYESDFGRIIFSPAIRRMHDKTQVFPLTSDDNIHSRLTHSLEVMALGHSLGIRLIEHNLFKSKINIDKYEALRAIPVILKNACLVHDIGNPPFGHFGETSIQNFFKDYFKDGKNKLHSDESLNKRYQEDFLFFDGNAQGFRVITKLQVLDDSYGLNLTHATLSTSLKYPNTGELVSNKLNLKKRGVFQSEKEYLNIISDKCGLIQGNNEIIRHPLSFIMEASDSICYRVMDIEDGYNKGWYSYNYIEEFMSEIPELKNLLQKLRNDPKIISGTNHMVNFRIGVIGILANHAINNFVSSYDSIANGTYHKELIEDRDAIQVEKRLKLFCKQNIFPKREIQSLELTGEAVISGLLEYYTTYLFHDKDAYRSRAESLISKSIIKAALIETDCKKFEDLDKYYKLRVIVDFISGMTDKFALSHYQKLSGQKI
jgi:dGTPase